MKKEADNFVMFGAYDASIFDPKRNRESKSTEIRNLTFLDKIVHSSN